jgi:NADPH:quinone reductase-like Zn-dependent oxidoreductase
METKTKLPEEMKAAIVDHFGPPDVVHTTRIRVPKLGRREILIRVEAAAVGEWDPALIDGSFSDVKRKLPTVFGADGAGVVEAVGPGVRNFHPGDQVYGWGWGNKKGGFFAEYIAVKESDASKIPMGLSMKEAAALPISGITAMQGLDQLRLEPGQTLLLIGASGGVGHVALQLAKLQGLKVFAVASGDDGVELDQRLGADVVIEGHQGGFEERARAFAPDGFDGALVYAGGDGWKNAMSLVKPGGRIAWPHGVEPEPFIPEGIKGKAYDGKASAREFERLNALIARGPFHIEVSRTYPLEQCADAVRDVQGHHIGKLGVQVH